MKATIFVNTLENYITNQQIIEVMEGLNDPFYGQIVKEDIEVTISLWDVRVSMTGYGHWKIAVKMELNGVEKTFTKTTTNSTAVDAMKQSDDTNEDNEKEDGYLSLFSECMNANGDEVYEVLDKED